MNREDTKKAIVVMQAFVDGAEIQYKNDNFDWVTCTHETATISWNHIEFTYRIKPKPREFWINLASRVAMLADDGWKPTTIDPIRDIKVREVLDE